MPEWNSKNRIPMENVEKEKSLEPSETEDKATKIYNESARDFIRSIENDPNFKELVGEIIELKGEIEKVSQEYKKKEQDIVVKRVGAIRQFIGDFVEKTKTRKTLQALVAALILESTFIGYDIFTSHLKPEINLVYNVAKLAKTIKYTVFFDEKENEIISFLRQKIPQREIDWICDLKNKEDGEGGEKEGIRRKIPLIENIEGLGISQKDMKSILKTFPDGFLANINKIRYEAKYVKMPEIYGIQGFQRAQSNRTSKIIIFFKSEKKSIEDAGEIYLISGEVVKNKNYFILSSDIAHEMAHLNDWSTNSFLNTKDRLSLLKTIIKRVESKDRCNFSFVESISNEDKKIELIFKAIEYFAKIYEFYFNSPDILPNKDKKIIEEMIEKTDPMFDQKKNEKDTERLAIIEKMNYK